MSVLSEAVDREAVRAQLAARHPELLEDPNQRSLFEHALAGIAAEVEAVTGTPVPVTAFDLAKQAVVLGTAMSIESAMFPEQITGDTSRAEQLRDRYVALLAQLKSMVPAPAGTAGASRVRSVVMRNPWVRTDAVPAPLQPAAQPSGTYLQWDQVP